MTLAEIIANAGSNSEFVPGMSSNELFFGTLTDERLTDVIADVAEACQGKAESDHTHTGFAPAEHSHSGYAPAEHSHTGYAAAEHTHNYAASNHGHSYNDLSDKPTIPTVPAPQAITAHLAAATYDAPVGGAWTTIPLTASVSTGNGFTIENNQIRVGAGISKVLVSAQICVGSASVSGNKYLSIRKNASQQKARTQIRLHEAYTPETMCIPPLVVDVEEGDLLTIDYSGAQGDAIYGELIFTYLTVQKIA